MNNLSINSCYTKIPLNVGNSLSSFMSNSVAFSTASSLLNIELSALFWTYEQDKIKTAKFE